MTSLDEYVKEEVNKYRDIYRPVKAGLLRRLFVRYLACKKIHPNPDDEFCNPAIGPNYEIISRYADEIKRIRRNDSHAKFFEEPVMVERISPDGYMLLNGHHRWAASIRMGLPKIRTKVVNLTQVSDIREMLRNAKHEKRVTLDLDEVVFVSDPGAESEKPLPFPLSLRYKERLRRGIPALFHYLKREGYDIWVYSVSYYSMDHIRRLFGCYRAWVDGVVTGMGRKSRDLVEHRKNLEDQIAKKYPQTIHIDNGSLLRIDSRTRAYDEFALSGNPATWSQEIMEIIGAFDKT
jgi:hypothetical protein